MSQRKKMFSKLAMAGGNVNDLMRSIGWTPDQLSARVFIDGEYIKDDAWEYTVPRQSVVVRAIPTGGGGGGNQGKDTGRMVAMIGIMVLAIATQQYWAAGLVAATGGMLSVTVATAVGFGAISITSSLALSGLIPAPLPRRTLSRPLEDRRQVAA
jgi:hypothetical protein